MRLPCFTKLLEYTVQCWRKSRTCGSKSTAKHVFTKVCICSHTDACWCARLDAGHNFVGTEQILLGLIGESTGIAAKVLKSMGVNLKDTRVEVEKIIGRGSGFVAVEIPFTPRAKRVLELSLEEARQLGGSRLRLHLYALSHACCSHASCNKS